MSSRPFSFYVSDDNCLFRILIFHFVFDWLPNVSKLFLWFQLVPHQNKIFPPMVQAAKRPGQRLKAEPSGEKFKNKMILFAKIIKENRAKFADTLY